MDTWGSCIGEGHGIRVVGDIVRVEDLKSIKSLIDIRLYPRYVKL